MYFWKCWRDSRARFLAFTVVAVAVGIISAWVGIELMGQQVTSMLLKNATPGMIRECWMQALSSLMMFGGLVMIVVGSSFGITGLGEEMELGSGSFLLSRPRRRPYFVWTAAVLGWIEVLAFACLLSLATFVWLLYRTGSFGTWRIFAPIPVFFVTGLLTHGLTQLLAALGRNTRNASSGTLAISLAYLYVSYRLYLVLRIGIPTPADMYVLRPEPGAIPVGTILAWVGVALLFPLLQQLLLKRVEA